MMAGMVTVLTLWRGLFPSNRWLLFPSTSPTFRSLSHPLLHFLPSFWASGSSQVVQHSMDVPFPSLHACARYAYVLGMARLACGSNLQSSQASLQVASMSSSQVVSLSSSSSRLCQVLPSRLCQALQVVSVKLFKLRTRLFLKLQSRVLC
jgi:hypothetical protein